MKSDVQALRKATWSVDTVTPMSWLVIIRPYGLEGTEEIVCDDGEVRRIEVDKHWDNTFGYTFGEVVVIGSEAERRLPDLYVGAFVHFTRAAYSDALDKQGRNWVFVNWEDIITMIDGTGNGEEVLRSVEAKNDLDAGAITA